MFFVRVVAKAINIKPCEALKNLSSQPIATSCEDRF